MGRVLVQQPGTNTTKALSETLPKNVIIVDEGLKELRLHDGVTPGGKLIGQSTGVGVPIGTIIPFAGNAIPQGYLLCDGSAISRTDYASLFAVIGTIYGAGDGNSTFNLPNLIDKSPWHSGQYQYGQATNGMIPNITGTMENIASRHPSNPSLSGAFYLTSGNGARTGDVYTSGAGIGFAASRVSSLYTNTGIVVPAALLIPGWIIKY